MANIKIQPVSLPSVAIYNAGFTYFKTPVINNAAGTPIDFSTWFALTANLDDASGQANPDGQGIGTPITGVTKNADGTIDIAFDPSEVNNLARFGAYVLTIVGEPVSGDESQLVATGQANFVRTAAQ